MSIHKIFIIGGMGAGKSTATHALNRRGLKTIDLDKLGHNVLHWDTVKEEMIAEFGSDILDENGEIIRKNLAKKAFATEEATHKLNSISMPRIEQAYMDTCEELENKGHKACIVECSVFKSRSGSLAYTADVLIAVIAEMQTRIKRAVDAGWPEKDVRARIARQITDAERIEAADVVFTNDGAKEDLERQALKWWNKYRDEHDLMVKF